MRTNGSFNTSNNSRDSFRAKCTDRWRLIITPSMHQEALPKRRHLHPNGWNPGEDIYAFLTVVKMYEKRQSYFLIIPYLSHKFCSDFGIGGVVAGTTPVFNSARRDFIRYIGTSNGGWISPNLHHSTDVLTLHQFGAVCGDDSKIWPSGC